MANLAINGDHQAVSYIKKAHSDLLKEVKDGTVNKEEYKAEVLFLSILCDGLSNIEREASC